MYLYDSRLLPPKHRTHLYLPLAKVAFEKNENSVENSVIAFKCPTFKCLTCSLYRFCHLFSLGVAYTRARKASTFFTDDPKLYEVREGRRWGEKTILFISLEPT